MAKNVKNIPVGLDEEFIAEIDAIADRMGESRSTVMRMAMRRGLALVEQGPQAIPVQLTPSDSTLVELASSHRGVPAERICNEALSLGISAWVWLNVRAEKLFENMPHDPKLPLGEQDLVWRKKFTVSSAILQSEKLVTELFRRKEMDEIDDVLRHRPLGPFTISTEMNVAATVRRMVFFFEERIANLVRLLSCMDDSCYQKISKQLKEIDEASHTILRLISAHDEDFRVQMEERLNRKRLETKGSKGGNKVGPGDQQQAGTSGLEKTKERSGKGKRVKP